MLLFTPHVRPRLRVHGAVVQWLYCRDCDGLSVALRGGQLDRMREPVVGIARRLGMGDVECDPSCWVGWSHSRCAQVLGRLATQVSTLLQGKHKVCACVCRRMRLPVVETTNGVWTWSCWQLSTPGRWRPVVCCSTTVSLCCCK